MNIKEKPLAPFHFYTPERPKEEDYTIFDEIPPLNGKIYEKARDKFQQALSEWERLYGPEPEPEWISYYSRVPEEGAVCYWSRYPTTHSEGLSNHYISQYFVQKIGEYWLDKAVYDKIVQNWQYRQKRYDWEYNGLHTFTKYYSKSGKYPFAGITFNQI